MSRASFIKQPDARVARQAHLGRIRDRWADTPHLTPRAVILDGAVVFQFPDCRTWEDAERIRELLQHVDTDMASLVLAAEQGVAPPMRDDDLAGGFGARLEHIRREAGFSVTNLALAAGVGRSTIHQYERDDRVPQLRVLVSLAKTLRVSIDHLVGWNAEDALQNRQRRNGSYTNGKL